MSNFFVGFPVPYAKIAGMIESAAPPLAHISNHIPGGSDPFVASMADGQILVWNTAAGAFVAATPSAGGGLGAYANTDLFYHSFIETLDGLEQYTSDNGAITLDEQGMMLDSSATSGGYMRIYKYLRFATVPLSWAKVRKIKCRARLRALTNNLGIIEFKTGLSGNQLGFGFRIVDGVIKGFCYNGAESITGVLLNFESGPFDETKTLEAVFTPTERVEFYVNDIKLGQVTTNLPTGADGDYVAICALVDNDNNAKRIFFQTSEFKFYQAA